MCVFFMKRGISDGATRALNGFAGGVMVAASVWSLLIPSMSASSAMGRLSFIPAVVGFFAGILFLLFLDKAVPHTHINNQSEGPRSRMGKNALLFFAITLHNIPEGVAIGVVFASFLAGGVDVSLAEATALSVGIAIQNLPEGAIISMPLCPKLGKGRSFLYGVVSGAVEPIAALITILLAELLLPVFPYLLSFAAGAMIFVVVEELIPEMTNGDHSADIGTIMFALGFSIMMSMDVALG
ncbi:MAG: ZIP family metal transporter [Clostridia bacterium]|nr:ZIP family metal transporter [Clostridia bacterium]